MCVLPGDEAGSSGRGHQGGHAGRQRGLPHAPHAACQRCAGQGEHHKFKEDAHAGRSLPCAASQIDDTYQARFKEVALMFEHSGCCWPENPRAEDLVSRSPHCSVPGIKSQSVKMLAPHTCLVGSLLLMLMHMLRLMSCSCGPSQHLKPLLSHTPYLSAVPSAWNPLVVLPQPCHTGPLAAPPGPDTGLAYRYAPRPVQGQGSS